LEAAAKEHEALIGQGLLLKKDVVDRTEAQLKGELAAEQTRRAKAETQKKRMEGEVESLTAALFEEANEMVATARRDTEASEKRTEQLQKRLNDTEALLTSQQEQLQELKAVMQDMGSDRGDAESHTASAPSTPALPSKRMSHGLEPSVLTPIAPGQSNIEPDQPLRFSYLFHTVLRTDQAHYEDFKVLLGTSKTAPNSRATSGNFSALAPKGLGSSGSSPMPGSPALGSSSPRDSSVNIPVVPLKETRFYRYALTEDIEPTLRLDIAPGISWLARRTVINSMTTGSLIVEPMPKYNNNVYYGPIFACGLCGEVRKGEPHKRRHRFRTSEAEDAQRYPLCDYCLGRLRSTCDYVGFLRACRDGHWRADGEDEMKAAWEESVRLREKMFWARVGGGVVPAYGRASGAEMPRSPRLGQIPAEDEEEERSSTDEVAVARRRTPADPFQSKNADKEPERRGPVGKTALSRLSDAAAASDEEKENASVEPQGLGISEQRRSEDEAEKQLHSEMQKRASVQSVEKRRSDRLSITIPGAFE